MGGRALRLTSTVAMLMSLSPQERCWLMFWRTNLLKYRCRWKNDATPIADTILTNADVQVILKVTPTLSQHMLLADLDVTSIAFDGRYVYGSQRSVRALSHRCIWHALIERLVNDQALQSFWKAFDPINERNRDVVYSLRHAFSSIAKSSDTGVQTYRECIWNFWKKVTCYCRGSAETKLVQITLFRSTCHREHSIAWKALHVISAMPCTARCAMIRSWNCLTAERAIG